MADIKISDLPSAAAASGSMQIEVNDSGTSKKVTADQLKTFAVPDGSITDAKLNTGAVTNTKIADGAVTELKLADGAVSANKIASNAVTTAKVADGNITPAKLSTGAPSWNTSGDVTLGRSLTINGAANEKVFAITDGTVDINPANGTIQTWTLGASRTPTASSFASGQSVTLMIDDGAGATITWSSIGVQWKTNTGTAPTLNTSGFTAIQLWKVGSTVYGARVGDA